MKDSQMLYTWAMLFFATTLLATGGAILLAFAVGVVCSICGFVAMWREATNEEQRQELMSKHT